MTSPIEKKLGEELELAVFALDWTLERHVRVGKYTLDFVVTSKGGTKVCVEADGFNYHDRTTEQAIHDRARDRWVLRELGVPTLRYLSNEIFDNAEACMSDVVRTVFMLEKRQSARDLFWFDAGKPAKKNDIGTEEHW